MAETRIPVPSADTPAQNWRAADFESLWDAPIVGSTGSTVGQAVCEALEPGEELPRRLAGLGDSLGDSIGLAAPAFVQHHLAARRVRRTSAASSPSSRGTRGRQSWRSSTPAAAGWWRQVSQAWRHWANARLQGQRGVDEGGTAPCLRELPAPAASMATARGNDPIWRAVPGAQIAPSRALSQLSSVPTRLRR